MTIFPCGINFLLWIPSVLLLAKTQIALIFLDCYHEIFVLIVEIFSISRHLHQPEVSQLICRPLFREFSIEG